MRQAEGIFVILHIIYTLICRKIYHSRTLATAAVPERFLHQIARFFARSRTQLRTMDHPFLQFDPNNEREALCIPKRDELWARRGQFGVPRWLDWEVMQELNQYDRLENMMSRPLINLVGCN